MAAVDRGSSGAAPEPPPTNAARSVEAERLLDMFTAAKPINPDAFVPEVGMPGGGDIQLQPGLYTYALIGPEVWPTESESQLSELEDELARLADHHESCIRECWMHKWARYLVNTGQLVMVRLRLRSTTRRSALLTSSSPKHAGISAAATAASAATSGASSVRSAKPMTKRTAKLRKRYALTKVCR